MSRPILLAHAWRWGFPGVLALAAAVRLYLLWQYYCISSDGVVYIQTARDFYAGNFLAALGSVYPPVYPLLIAGAYPLVGDWELAGQLVSWFFGVLLLFPLYWIFTEAFNEGVALLACFLAGISPFLAVYSVHVRSESSYLFFSALALYFFLTGVERADAGRFFLGGLVAGWAYLIRPEAIGFLAIVPAVALLRSTLRRSEIVSGWISSTALLALGFLLCSLPYIVYLSADTGRVGAISRKAGITLMLNLKASGLLEADEPQADDSGSLAFTDYVTQHPVRYSQMVLSDLFPAFGYFLETLHYSYAPFLALGLFVVLRERFWTKPQLLLLGFVLFYVFGFALIYVKRRYSLQAVPITLGWVAVGMAYGWDRLRALMAPQRAAWIAAGVALLFLGATVPKTLKPVSRDKAYVRETGRYLKARNPGKNLQVAVVDERITFYADAGTILLNGVAETDLARKLRAQKADYLAADTRTLRRSYPEMIKAPDRYGLILEKTFVGTRQGEIMLFKVT